MCLDFLSLLLIFLFNIRFWTIFLYKNLLPPFASTKSRSILINYSHYVKDIILLIKPPNINKKSYLSFYCTNNLIIGWKFSNSVIFISGDEKHQFISCNFQIIYFIVYLLCFFFPFLNISMNYCDGQHTQFAGPLCFSFFSTWPIMFIHAMQVAKLKSYLIIKQ